VSQKERVLANNFQFHYFSMDLVDLELTAKAPDPAHPQIIGPHSARLSATPRKRQETFDS